MHKWKNFPNTRSEQLQFQRKDRKRPNLLNHAALYSRQYFLFCLFIGKVWWLTNWNTTYTLPLTGLRMRKLGIWIWIYNFHSFSPHFHNQDGHSEPPPPSTSRFRTMFLTCCWPHGATGWGWSNQGGLFGGIWSWDPGPRGPPEAGSCTPDPVVSYSVEPARGSWDLPSSETHWRLL